MSNALNVVDFSSHQDFPPGDAARISRVVEELIDLHGRKRVDEAMLSARSGAEAAFALSMRDDLTARERAGWLWVAASRRHVAAAEQMSVSTQIRALSSFGSVRHRAISDVAAAWNEFSRTLSIGGVDDFYDDRHDLLEAAVEADALLSGFASSGVVVVPAIGDADSKQGKAIAKRYETGVGRALPWSGALPEAGEIAREIAALWPWAADVGREIEQRLESARRSKGARIKLPPLLFVGAEGSGKGELAGWLARRLRMEAVTVRCGGANDAGGIVSIGREFGASRPSALAARMLENGTCNPMLVIEGIEAVGTLGVDLRAMIATKSSFDACLDAYVDLEGVSFVATATRTDLVSPALLRHFVVLRMPSPQMGDFDSIIENQAIQLAERNGIARDEVPALGAAESDRLRDWFSKGRSAPALALAYDRVMSTRIEGMERARTAG